LIQSDKPRFATLDAWLSWLETLHPTEIELGLERVRQVADRMQLSAYFETRSSLGSPFIITIAGTNGKGSTVKALEALLISAEESTGSYTSPHLLHYNERIKINGEPVDDQIICQAFAAVDKARGDISLTYFEFGTLAAFHIFNVSKIHYWLLEVGLGGRLDAVNCLAPDIAVITSIALDHEAWLGTSRDAIALEKAGILRPGIPLVCADVDPPSSLFQAIQSNQVPAWLIGRDYSYVRNDQGLEFHVSGRQIHLSDCSLPLPSVAAALQIFALAGYEQQLDKAEDVLAAISLEGRLSLHRTASGKRYWLDVAHNPAAAQMLSARLAQKELGAINAVVAMMSDKDIPGSLSPLISNVHNWFVIPLHNNPRAAKPEKVKEILEQLGVDDRAIQVCDAFEYAVAKLETERFSGVDVLVFGSFFTVAEALKHLKASELSSA